MIVTLAVRSLLARPFRTSVLACGFGLGVGVMATLLGVGQVILVQARAPSLAGGGDLVILGTAGHVPNARYLIAHVLGAPPFDARMAAAAPTRRATLYAVRENGTMAVSVRGGLPSLERALRDPETASSPVWRDAPADAAWTSPDPAELLRAMDRFHAIPDVPARAGSWAEWLYFNGHASAASLKAGSTAGTARFRLAFIVGPVQAPGRRMAQVLLYLDRAGRQKGYAYTGEVDEAAVLREAPELTVGPNRVRLDGLRYRIHLELAETRETRGQSPGGFAGRGESPRLTGELVLEAVPGRSIPPFAMTGSHGWVLGYTVPVTEGALAGRLLVEGAPVSFDGGAGYHDHNWGFWEGVTWQWGQVAHGGMSFVYGRVHPPADAADPARVPGLLMAFGPEGPAGYTADVSIEEHEAAGAAHPARIIVRGRGRQVDLTMELDVEEAIVTRLDRLAIGQASDFLQLRVRYRVSGRLGDREISFSAPGAAETFRGR